MHAYDCPPEEALEAATIQPITVTVETQEEYDLYLERLKELSPWHRVYDSLFTGECDCAVAKIKLEVAC